MMLTLTPADAAAIDLLLDGGVSDSFAQPRQSQSPLRFHAAERTLQILAALPAEEPPADLVSRTLSRIAIESHYQGVPSMPFVSDPQAHA